ncbi:hypothetical protein ACFQV4_29190 [Streptomyces thermocarboxydus]
MAATDLRAAGRPRTMRGAAPVLPARPDGRSPMSIMPSPEVNAMIFILTGEAHRRGRGPRLREPRALRPAGPQDRPDVRADPEVGARHRPGHAGRPVEGVRRSDGHPHRRRRQELPAGVLRTAGQDRRGLGARPPWTSWSPSGR